MGEVSELIQEGAVCAGCGQEMSFGQEPPGYPRSCSPKCAQISGEPEEELPLSQWQYLVEEKDGVAPVAWLDEKGLKGWELTAVVPTHHGLTYIFKREIYLPEEEEGFDDEEDD